MKKNVKALIMTFLLVLGTSVTVAQQASAESGVGVGEERASLIGASQGRDSWSGDGGSAFYNYGASASGARAQASAGMSARAKSTRHRVSGKARTRDGAKAGY